MVLHSKVRQPSTGSSTNRASGAEEIPSVENWYACLQAYAKHCIHFSGRRKGTNIQTKERDLLIDGYNTEANIDNS